MVNDCSFVVIWVYLRAIQGAGELTGLVLESGRILDVSLGEYLEGHSVIVEDGLIADVVPDGRAPAHFDKVDLGNRVLMPGLIDAHVHVTALQMDLGGLQTLPPSLIAAGAAAKMNAMLLRGFTSGRDAGGADDGLVQAVARGYVNGPRLFVSGKALSQTGGHGDWRNINQNVDSYSDHIGFAISRIADGVPEVRRAARDELRKGAKQIKVMVNGGISTPNDPITTLQYSDSELVAIVEEASAWGTYVMAHAYTAASIRRAVRAGIRSIEHANLIDDDTARYVAEAGAYVVPTLSTFEMSSRFGAELGFPVSAMEKLSEVWAEGLSSIERCVRAGVKLGLGTDLLGPLDRFEGREMTARRDIMKPIDVIRSATLVNAEILNMTGKLGVVAPGAYADILVVEGDPLKDLTVFETPDTALAAIMKGGTFYKKSL